ncbi:MAG: HAD family hydrolase [Myxococcota bacterium]
MAEGESRLGRERRVAAFFDVDKTILSENSGALYFRFLYERGELDWRSMLGQVASYVRYKLNLLDLERWTRATMRAFAGQSERELALEAGAWFHEWVLPTVYPEAVERVRDHLARGHVVSLVTGSTRFVVHPLARFLGVEHMLYTHLEVEDGRFTGRIVEPVCMGEGKIYWLQQLIERESIDLAKSFFYTDSITDLPLLNLVGHPHVVNPDPLLYREARRRRWPVSLFQDPTPAAAPEGEAPRPAS